MPSLLQQLAEAVVSGAGGHGRGKQGSRPPLDIAAMSLMLEIVSCVREALIGFDRKPDPDTGESVRDLASELLRHPDEADAVDWWTSQFRSWGGQIRAAISSDPDRPTRLWGVACPECSVKFIPEIRDGEQVKRPAVFVHWNRKLLQAIECSACTASWFRGEQLDQLVDRMRLQVDASP
jgi:hypothetical protein